MVDRRGIEVWQNPGYLHKLSKTKNKPLKNNGIELDDLKHIFKEKILLIYENQCALYLKSIKFVLY